MLLTLKSQMNNREEQVTDNLVTTKRIMYKLNDDRVRIDEKCQHSISEVHNKIQ